MPIWYFQSKLVTMPLQHVPTPVMALVDMNRQASYPFPSVCMSCGFRSVLAISCLLYVSIFN